MEKISFFIDGIPTPKGRPRFYRTPFGVRTYTPKETQQWEAHVKECALKVMTEKKMNFHHGPVSAVLSFHIPPPKSLPKKTIFHIKRPDLDNLIKAVMDALNGTLFKDDSQVFSIFVKKIYSHTPGVEAEFTFFLP